MASPEQSYGGEKKKGGLLKSLGKLALFALGIVAGAEILEHSGLIKPAKLTKIK